MARFAVLLLALVIAFSSGAEAHKKHRKKSTKLPSPAVHINIDLSSQAMSVVVEGNHFARWDVSTGRAGYWTPRGSWRVNRMARVHYSKQFNNYPLPYAMFFVGGVAIHATKGEHKLGKPASHGCVRLANRNAAKLFALVKRHGMKRALVTVSN
jgi:lipoprotein-anchoring transpeptidase ErfK/SrfK